MGVMINCGVIKYLKVKDKNKPEQTRIDLNIKDKKVYGGGVEWFRTRENWN